MKTKAFLLLTTSLTLGVIVALFSSCNKDEDSGSSTIKDIDGNVYHSVTIGTQVWMVENLKVTKYNDNTSIDNITNTNTWNSLTSGAYCNYNNLDSYVSTYGRLYNWQAVNTGKLAPKGWRIPTKSDWETLIAFLGGEGVAGGKLKATGSVWASPNTGATNESGFSGLPGGCNVNGYVEIGLDGNYWSSTSETCNFAWFLNQYKDKSSAELACTNKNYGYSVRCIKE